MVARTQWVFRNACGCPFGVLEGSCAATKSAAWKDFFENRKERDRAFDRGVTVELMDHARYVAEVSPFLLSGVCTHGGPEARGGA